jgi:hypothetical protein
MTDHAELIKWLRTIADNMSGEAYNADPWFPAQRADVRGLHQSADALSALVAERDRLREALKPFAAQTRVSSLTEEAMILRARAALAQGGEP